jgi:hypothetical protein
MRRQHLVTASFQSFVTANPFKTNETRYAAAKTIVLPVATAR